METSIGLEKKDREKVIDILNVILADEFILYTKTLNYHWNVYGPHFNDMHLFFKAQYEQLFEIVDDVAERVRALGGDAIGSCVEFLDEARLDEEAGPIPTLETMLLNLLTDHEDLIQWLRVDLERCMDECGDAGTNNFLTDIMEKHEKMAWMLRASVTKPRQR